MLHHHESYLEPAAAALNSGQNLIFLDGRINRMGHHPHRFDAVAYVAETTADHVLVVVQPLPLFGRNAEDFRNGSSTVKERRRNSDQGMKQIEQYCPRASDHFLITCHAIKIIGFRKDYGVRAV